MRAQEYTRNNVPAHRDVDSLTRRETHKHGVVQQTKQKVANVQEGRGKRELVTLVGRIIGNVQGLLQLMLKEHKGGVAHENGKSNENDLPVRRQIVTAGCHHWHHRYHTIADIFAPVNIRTVRDQRILMSYLAVRRHGFCCGPAADDRLS